MEEVRLKEFEILHRDGGVVGITAAGNGADCRFRTIQVVGSVGMPFHGTGLHGAAGSLLRRESIHAFILVAATGARGDPFGRAAALHVVATAVTDSNRMVKGARKTGSHRGKLHQQQYRELQHCSEFSKAL